jgi:hypothetical protein
MPVVRVGELHVHRVENLLDRDVSAMRISRNRPLTVFAKTY